MKCPKDFRDLLRAGNSLDDIGPLVGDQRSGVASVGPDQRRDGDALHLEVLEVSPMSARLTLALTGALLAGACSGEIGSRVRRSGPRAPRLAMIPGPARRVRVPVPPVARPITGGPVGGPQPSDMPNVPGPAPLRRLSVREYRNTVRDLLGVDVPAGVDFAIDRDTAGFSVGSPVATSTDASRLLDAADQLAAAAASPPARPAALPDGPRRQRRPVRLRPAVHPEVRPARLPPPAERRRGGRPEGGLRRPPRARRSTRASPRPSRRSWRRCWSRPTSSTATSWARRRRCAMPRTQRRAAFNAHEMASRLSYALWGSMPDDQLFAQADANKLGSAARHRDPGAADAGRPQGRPGRMEDFHLQWLEVDSLAKAPKEAELQGLHARSWCRRCWPRPSASPAT